MFNNENSLLLNILTTASYGGYEYTFTNDEINGRLNYEKVEETNLKKEVNRMDDAIRSYSLAGNETVIEDLGYLGGTQLTIFGNGYEVDGNGKSGIEISNGQTLFVDRGTGENFVWKNFNKSGAGGVFYVDNGENLEISLATFINNQTTGQGGVICNKGKTTITDGVIFSSNISVSAGGAIYNDSNSTMTITGGNIVFDSNKSTNSDAGAILNQGTIMEIIGQHIGFNSNEASYAAKGGAIYNNSRMTINAEEIEFSSNTAGIMGGGAINNEYTETKMDIKGNSITFSSNSAGVGGAICNRQSSAMTITGETVVFNNNTSASRGGAIENDTGATMTIIGSNIDFKSNTAEIGGGAIYNSGSILNLVSTEKMEFTGNTANGISNAIHDYGGTINLYASENAKIIFNDRITSENSNSILNINNSNESLIQNVIGKIVLNEDMQGYTGQVNLYKGTVQIGQYGTWFLGNTYVDNATIDMANFVLQEHNFNTLQINKNLNLFVEADLAKKQMDTITANEDSDIQGKINVKAINILADATEDRTEILFTSSTVLKDKITAIKTASSGLYKYDVNYNNTGYFIFSKRGIDKVVTESQVAVAVGGTITQTAVLNQAFASIDSAIQDRYISYYEASNHKNMKKTDLYASTSDLLYAEDTNKIERGLWIRPYAMQDKININNLSVDNTAVGTLAGLDLSVGEDSIISFYIGYAGSNQKYEDIKVNQTGYVVGATGMIIKDDYYLGLTANINFNKAESENDYGTDKFDMNMYAVGAKAGYNVELGKKWILEPSLSLMYGNINTKEYEIKQGAQIASQSTSNILIEPQVKAKLDLTDGWTPYALVGYVFNSGNKTKLVANNIAFDDMQITGYAEYGLGVNKSFKDSLWSCFLQATGKGGDRKGFEGNIGIKYSL